MEAVVASQRVGEVGLLPNACRMHIAQPSNTPCLYDLELLWLITLYVSCDGVHRTYSAFAAKFPSERP